MPVSRTPGARRLAGRSSLRSRRRIVIAIGAVVLLAVATVGGFVLAGDSSSPKVASAPLTTAAAAESPTDSPTPSATPTSAEPSVSVPPPAPSHSVDSEPPPVVTRTIPAVSGTVGVTTVTYIDTTRTTPPRGDSDEQPSRTLNVTIRYPVANAGGDGEIDNAPVRPGNYPLLVFAHGFNVSADTYAALEREVALAGFIVAAPDFPMSSSALPGEADESDLGNQAGDVSFVISSLLDPAAVPQLLAGHISGGQVGVFGHSDGGVTAAAAAYNSSAYDSRIGAAAILSGGEEAYPGGWFTAGIPPLLTVQGTDDGINPYSDGVEIYYDDPGTPKYLVDVNGGGHLPPFTTDDIRPAISVLISDFFAAYLKHDAAALARIPGDASVDILSLAGIELP